MNESKKMTTVQIRSKKQLSHRILKAGIQILFFLFMPSAFVAGFHGIKNVFTWIGQGEPLQINAFVAVLIGISVFTILFGRFFCGYICAFGAAGDLCNLASELLQKYGFRRKKKYRLPEKWIRVLQKVKYINLAAVIVFCFTGTYSNLTGWSVWDVFSMITSMNSVQQTYAVGLGLMLLVFVMSMLQERFFCQFLCPMGAFLALLPILPFGRIRRKEENCIKGCNACRNRCPAVVKPDGDSAFSGECISCGKCRHQCPKGNIGYVEERFLPEAVPVLIRAGLFFTMGVLLGICRV